MPCWIIPGRIQESTMIYTLGVKISNIESWSRLIGAKRFEGADGHWLQKKEIKHDKCGYPLNSNIHIKSNAVQPDIEIEDFQQVHEEYVEGIELRLHNDGR